MPRLPVPGSDSDVWGELLNEFLSVEHNPDGTLKSASDIASSEQVANKGVADGYAGLGSDAKVPIAQLPTGSTSSTVALGDHTHVVTSLLPPFTRPDVLTLSAGRVRLPIDGNYSIVGVRLMVDTAPTGASIIVDINKNGTTIYTTQGNRPSISAGSNSGGPGVAPDISSIAAGDYLTVDVDQVGSIVAGSDLVVAVIVTRTT